MSTKQAKEDTMEKKPRAIVTVRRPELTPEERAKRMEEIKQAAHDLIVATMRAKATAAAS